MGSMTSPSSESLSEIFNRLDDRVRHVDEERWLSSRYAPANKRRSLIALYAFCYELARVRLVVTDPVMGAIRFQWWREALEELSDGKAREHDTVLALADRLNAKALQVESLEQLVDGYEAAYEEKDRSREPEAFLTAIAAKILADAHSWGENIRQLAPHWSALRRGEAIGIGPDVSCAPSAIRPAIAHFRLRRSWGVDKKLPPFSKRMSVLLAIVSGHI
jgi:phytoene synthase